MPADVMSRIQQRMTGALPPPSAPDQRKIDLLSRAREIPGRCVRTSSRAEPLPNRFPASPTDRTPRHCR